MHHPVTSGTALTLVPARTARETLEVAKRAKKTPLQKRTTPQETLGQRLARLRRVKGLTQKELAEALDVSQPMISMYERGELRLHGEAILQLCSVLEVSADELLGIKPTNGHEVVPNRRLARRLQKIEQLPRRDQDAILRTLDAFLGKED